jgi:hypothetical protein
MTRSRHFFAFSPWIATGTPDYVNLGDTSRGLAKQALMRLSPKSFAIFHKLGLGWQIPPDREYWISIGNPLFPYSSDLRAFPRLVPWKTTAALMYYMGLASPIHNPLLLRQLCACPDS